MYSIFVDDMIFQKCSLNDFIENVVELLSQRIIRPPIYSNEEADEMGEDDEEEYSESEEEEEIQWNDLYTFSGFVDDFHRDGQIRRISADDLTTTTKLNETVIEKTFAG